MTDYKKEHQEEMIYDPACIIEDQNIEIEELKAKVKKLKATIKDMNERFHRQVVEMQETHRANRQLDKEYYEGLLKKKASE